MTAKQVLNAKAGQKIGLGNGLRLVCDARNGARYFELRKRVRGKDYSWGVGNVETLTIAGFNKALSSARQQADRILEAIAAGADPAGIGKAARSTETLTGRSPLRDVGKQYVADKGDEWSSETYRNNYLNGLEVHCPWLMDSPVADINLDMVIEAIQPIWRTKTETASKMARRVSRVLNYAILEKLFNDNTADWPGKRYAQPDEISSIAAVKKCRAMSYSPSDVL